MYMHVGRRDLPSCTQPRGYHYLALAHLAEYRAVGIVKLRIRCLSSP